MSCSGKSISVDVAYGQKTDGREIWLRIYSALKCKNARPNTAVIRGTQLPQGTAHGTEHSIVPRIVTALLHPLYMTNECIGLSVYRPLSAFKTQKNEILKTSCWYTAATTVGATENARLEFGTIKNAGVENAGLKLSASYCRGRKMRDRNYREQSRISSLAFSAPPAVSLYSTCSTNTNPIF